MPLIKNDANHKLLNEKILSRIVDFEKPGAENWRFKDLTGTQYKYIHVDSYCGKDETNETYYWCTCICGTKFICRATSLRSKSTISCGCIQALNASTRRKNAIKKQNGLSNSRIYNIYHKMKNRCYNIHNDSFEHYGGRGICVTDEWLDKKDGFLNFYNWAIENGYNDDLTLDRIDVDGNYEPSNCRWVNRKIQQNNRRVTRYIQIDHYIFSVSIWANIMNIPTSIIESRLVLGWNPIDAVLVPNKMRGKKYKPGKMPLRELNVPQKYEIYNKYDEWVNKGYITNFIDEEINTI